MKHILTWTLALIVLSTCTQKDDILIAKFVDKGYTTTTECTFTLHSDSTYTFKLHEFQKFTHERNEIFRGRYFQTGDSIIFTPFSFEYTSAETAILKNNYLEFIGGKRPLKMKIINRQTKDYNGIDTVAYNDYSFFTYDSAFYKIFPEQVSPYDLTSEDLMKIEKILKSCVKKRDLSFELKDYFKQCIAVRNQHNERKVWINFLCNPKDVEKLKYFLIWTHDGGDCYFSIKINLDNGECYDFWVNGVS